jgi:hypothetical protein
MRGKPSSTVVYPSYVGKCAIRVSQTLPPNPALGFSSATRSLSASTHPYSIFQLGVKPEVTWLYICKTNAEIRPESFAIAHSALVKSFSIVENSL